MTASTGLQRVIGHFISIVFHPLFIPGYITAFLLYLHPFAFAGENDWYKGIKLLSVMISTAFFPAFTVLLLKLLGFANSVTLNTKKERIIPIIASMIYYFWIFYVSKNQPDNPPELVEMLCAVFISSIIALTANNFIKISLHTIAMGILASFFIYIAWNSLVPMGLPLAIALFIAGLVGTARFMASDHSQGELVWGYISGAISMVIAVWVIA
jgi:hypothetical protein